jgi:hypothetical protein
MAKRGLTKVDRELHWGWWNGMADRGQHQLIAFALEDPELKKRFAWWRRPAKKRRLPTQVELGLLFDLVQGTGSSDASPSPKAHSEHD